MPPNYRKVELLAPAGNFEKLELAIRYGADAVYLGGKSFSLRNFSGNFTRKELGEAVAYAHQHRVKVYVACNIYTRNDEHAAVAEFLRDIARSGADAVIVADPGVVQQARESIPDVPIHLSTQANTTNINSVLFWENVGIHRINLARELSLAEIESICAKSRSEIETFIHGAMCMSYSGRCLLSSYLTKRESNRGECTHPCRWRYAVVEETRPGRYMPIAEDERGTYIFNARDLCMIHHIPALIEAGISALKIEGRMKGIHYLATTVGIYRQAIDAYYRQPRQYAVNPIWVAELDKVNLRGYCTGFYFDDATQIEADVEKSPRIPSVKMVAKVIAPTDHGRCLVDIRNKVCKGDRVEILTRQGPPTPDRIVGIVDSDGKGQDVAQPGCRVNLVMHHSVQPLDLIRRIADPASAV